MEKQTSKQMIAKILALIEKQRIGGWLTPEVEKLRLEIKNLYMEDN
jgi:hypothetical protein